MIQLNGAAAHVVSVGDRVIILAYATVALPLQETWQPKVAVLNEQNRIARWIDEPSAGVLEIAGARHVA